MYLNFESSLWSKMIEHQLEEELYTILNVKTRKCLYYLVYGGGRSPFKPESWTGILVSVVTKFPDWSKTTDDGGGKTVAAFTAISPRDAFLPSDVMTRHKLISCMIWFHSLKKKEMSSCLFSAFCFLPLNLGYSFKSAFWNSGKSWFPVLSSQRIRFEKLADL